MQNREGSFGEEVADQVGIFLSVVTGFIVANGWNNALLNHCSKQKNEKNENWYMWVYALVATIIALIIMIIWGYFVAKRLYRPSLELDQLRKNCHGTITTAHKLLQKI